MAQFWIATFFILLAVAQLYQSIKDINLPLPVYLVLGTILAVASNSQQQFSVTLDRHPTRQEIEPSNPVLSLVQSPIPEHPIQPIDSKVLAPQQEVEVDNDLQSLLPPEPETPQREIEVDDDNIQLDVQSLLLPEPETSQAEVKLDDDLQLVDSDVLPQQSKVKLKKDVKSVERKKSRKRTTPAKTRKQ